MIKVKIHCQRNNGVDIHEELLADMAEYVTKHKEWIKDGYTTIGTFYPPWSIIQISFEEV